MQQLDSQAIELLADADAYAHSDQPARRSGRVTVRSTPLRSLPEPMAIRGNGSRHRPRAIRRALSAVGRGLECPKRQLYRRLAALAPAGKREAVVSPSKGVPAQFKRHAKRADEYSGRRRRSEIIGNLRAFLLVVLRALCQRTGRIGRRMPGGGWEYTTLAELDQYIFGSAVLCERSFDRTRRMLAFCEAHGLIETLRDPTPIPEPGGRWRAPPLRKRLTQRGADMLAIGITFEKQAAGQLRGAERQRELQIGSPVRPDVVESAAAVPAEVATPAAQASDLGREIDPDPPPIRPPGDLVAGLWAELAAKLAD